MASGLALALALTLALSLLAPAPAAARDLLGVYGAWAAFRDPAVPRCYAIAQSTHTNAQSAHANRGNARADAQSAHTTPLAAPAYADIGDWPAKGLRGQFHARLARAPAQNAPVTLAINGQRIRLAAQGSDVWAPDRRADAAITAAMRSAPGFTIATRDAAGHPFSETWPLDGAATAMDAALLGCAAHG